MNIGQILFVGSEIFCFVFYFYIGTLFGLIGVLFIWTFLRKFRLVAEDWEGWQVQGRMMDIGHRRSNERGLMNSLLLQTRSQPVCAYVCSFYECGTHKNTNTHKLKYTNTHKKCKHTKHIGHTQIQSHQQMC